MGAVVDPDQPRRRWTWWARWTIGILTALSGTTAALLIAALGHCSAFGGRCPAEPEPVLQSDVFRLVTLTIGITIWIVGWCIRPNRSGATLALLAGLVLGALAGLAAATSATG